MNLVDYAIKKGGTATIKCPVLAEVASKAGCSPSTLYMIAKGFKKPSWKLAGRIEDATEKDVTNHDLRSDIFGEAPSTKARTARGATRQAA